MHEWAVIRAKEILNVPFSVPVENIPDPFSLPRKAS
jgi:hypothetical protein